MWRLLSPDKELRADSDYVTDQVPDSVSDWLVWSCHVPTYRAGPRCSVSHKFYVSNISDWSGASRSWSGRTGKVRVSSPS